MDSFDQFDLGAAMRAAITKKGYTQPSPIQELAIGPFIEGHDMIAQAQTGTGKTAAFGIPMLELHHDDERRGIVALVLCPTRELALQVSAELAELADGSHLSVVTIYGGAGFGKQTDMLQRRGTKIVVATPGRLMDFMQRNIADLSKVSTLVLDEADRMLDMGFVRDVERIMEDLPKDRQTALFSATMPPAVKKLADRFLIDPVHLEIAAPTSTADRVEQFYAKVERTDKLGALFQLLDSERPDQAIVFTRTKHLAKRVSDRLVKGGWASVALQGNMTQGQRERALGHFRNGTARVLVATDVAARGLDVPAVSHVFNFDVPDEIDAYVHRIGRTARMGREGRAFTFVQPDQRGDLRAIEKTARTSLTKFELGPVSETHVPGPDVDKIAALVQHARQGAGLHAGAPRGAGAGGRHGGGGKKPRQGHGRRIRR